MPHAFNTLYFEMGEDSQKVPKIAEGDGACPSFSFLSGYASVTYHSVKAVGSTGHGAGHSWVGRGHPGRGA